MVEDLKSKVELLKKEVEKAKQDIQDIYNKFEKHKYINEKEHFKHLFCFEMRYTIKREFIAFLKENMNYIGGKQNLKKFRKIKLIGITEYPQHEPNKYNKYYYKKEVVDQFKEALSIMDKYGDEYEKDLLEKEFCKLTDCYDKLKTTITCKRCESEIPKEGNFCPQCGYNTVVNIRKEANSYTEFPNIKVEDGIDAMGNCNSNGMIFGKAEPLNYYDLTDATKNNIINHLAVSLDKKEKVKLCPNNDNCFSFNHNDRWCLGLTNPYNYRNYMCFKPLKQPETQKREAKHNYELNSSYKCHFNLYCLHYSIYSRNCHTYDEIYKCEYYIKKEVVKCPHYEKCTDPVKKSETSCCHDIKFMYAIETCESYIKFQKEKKCLYYDKCTKHYKNPESVCNNIKDMWIIGGCESYQKFEKEAKTPKTCDNCNQDKCNSGSCIDKSRWTPKYKEEKVLCDSCVFYDHPKCKGLNKSSFTSCSDYWSKDGWQCHVADFCKLYFPSLKCNSEACKKCDYYDKGGKK